MDNKKIHYQDIDPKKNTKEKKEEEKDQHNKKSLIFKTLIKKHFLKRPAHNQHIKDNKKKDSQTRVSV